MTSSVQYWRLPEEEVDMVAYLQSTGSIMGLPVRRVVSVEQLVWKSIDEALHEPDAAFLITPAEFVSQMEVYRSDEGFSTDVVKTPALYYSRGQLAQQVLRSTSLSAEWSESLLTSFVGGRG